MNGAGVRIAGAIRAATAFTIGSWGDAFIPLATLAAAQALRFAAPHLGLEAPLVEKLVLGAWAASALAITPALGALYRSAVGGRPAVKIGPGGVQWAAGETRIAVMLAGLAVAAVLAALPAAVVGGGVVYLLRSAGIVHVPVLGPFSLGAIVAAPFVLAILWLGYLFVSRLSLALPASMAESALAPGEALRLSRRWGRSVGAPWRWWRFSPRWVCSPWRGGWSNWSPAKPQRWAGRPGQRWTPGWRGA